MRAVAVVRGVVALGILLAAAGRAHAIFPDEEARAGVRRLEERVGRIEADVGQRADRKALLDLLSELETVRREMAALRGQFEVLVNRIDGLDKRQKDLYVDLDTRLRKLEQAGAEKETAARQSAAETQAYETALAQFKANNFGSAIQGLQEFMKTYPTSPLAPSAQYWIGNAYYALRDYKSAIAEQQKVVATWPEHAKAPDAMLNIASSQAELGDVNGARNTLRLLVGKYPNSPAAEQAKQRLARR
ncbi:MAG: tol-pal system protein YbgF [Burkholderiales bacterium]|nr:tol-pal system protein YbgF [Burkholderiales bacterium]